MRAVVLLVTRLAGEEIGEATEILGLETFLDSLLLRALMLPLLLRCRVASLVRSTVEIGADGIGGVREVESVRARDWLRRFPSETVESFVLRREDFFPSSSESGSNTDTSAVSVGAGDGVGAQLLEDGVQWYEEDLSAAVLESGYLGDGFGDEMFRA